MMATIEELLMDMLDDGPADADAPHAALPALDSSLTEELTAMHAQTDLLRACAEPISPSAVAALEQQRVAFHAMMGEQRPDVAAAVVSGGIVVAVAAMISLGAAWWSAPTPVSVPTATVRDVTDRGAAGQSVSTASTQHVRPSSEVNSGSVSTASQPTVAAKSSSRDTQPAQEVLRDVSRTVLLEHRATLLARASHGSDGDAYRVYRDIYRVSLLLHDQAGAREALVRARALAERLGATADVERCDQDMQALR